jgi:hypothetical protein
MQMMKIDNLKIKTDAEGRYCLNDLHKAAGKEPKHQPRYWLANIQTQHLIAEIGSDSGIPLSVIKGGEGQGTYVCKELVYAYAMWISAPFHLKVIRAYDALVNNQVELAKHEQQREKARLESRYLNDAVKYSRTDSGKEVKHYHFSNEYDLINRIALGMTAKQFRINHGIPANESIRDYLSPMELSCITHLQNIDTGLIEADLTYEQRKAKLSRIYTQRYFGRLCDEIKRLEA